MNLAQFPRRGYVTTPTPIEHCPNFSKALGADIDVYIKRDDMLPGTAGATRPVSWTSASPMPCRKAAIRSSPAAPCSPTTAA